jgi:hypothetical protein
MKFLLSVVLGFVLFVPVYGFLTSHGMAKGSAILVFLAIAAAPYYVPARVWVALGGLVVVLWLIWGFVYPMYQAVRRSIANGEKAPAQFLAALKAAAEKGAEKLFHLPGAPISSAENLARAQEELQQAEQLCMQLPFASSFGEAQSLYCQKQDSGIFGPTKAYIDAIKNGVAGPALPPLEVDPSKLDSNSYHRCLGDATLPHSGDSPLEAAARSKALTNSAECNAPSIVQVPQKWRMCMELAIQVPHDDPNVVNPLAPEISACRAQLTNASP